MIKALFEEATLEINVFESPDVITASGGNSFNEEETLG